MKKHLFGFALFALIVGVSVAVFTIYKIQTEYNRFVESRINKTQPRDEPLKRETVANQSNLIPSQVESLNIDLRDNTINSEINLNWKGAGKPPETVYVVIRPFAENKLKTLQTATEVVVPKWNGNRATVRTKTFIQMREPSGLKNYYAFVDVFPQTAYRTKDWDGTRDIKSAHPVLLIHRNYKIVKLDQ